MSRPSVRLVLATSMVLLQPPSLHAASTLLLPIVDDPSGGSGSVVVQPIRQRAQPTRRLVYSCVTPGHVTFADRPCGLESNVRELKVTAPTPMAAGAAPDLSKVRQGPPASKRQPPVLSIAGDGADEDEQAAACRKLQATLDDVDSSMRAGYSAREAGRLWQRWRDAKARLQAAQC